MKEIKYEFCMSQFKPAIGALAILIIMVVAWSTYCLHKERKNIVYHHGLTLTKGAVPPAPAIRVQDKQLHPYWGNCNKCHVTTDVPTNPVSKAFAGPPISIKQPMTHKYWGNCNLCHMVTDGFKSTNQVAGGKGKLVAAAAPMAPPIAANAKATHPDYGGKCDTCHQILKTKAPAPGGLQPVALNQISASSLGLKVQEVTANQMWQLGLANEDGMLVLLVAPGSIADRAGIKQGDELIRMDTVRLETMADFTSALALVQPGKRIKVNLYRGKNSRNLYLRIPENLPQNLNVVAAGGPVGQNPPLTQNQVETMAEQFGVAKTPQAVQKAIKAQPAPAAFPDHGKVAVAASGPTLNSPVCANFGASPYFFLYDPLNNRYQVVGNPNYNDITGKGVQTGQYMADLGVSNVIAGHFSIDGHQTLQRLRINMYSGLTGPVSNALAMYNNGQLRVSAPAPTGGHPQARAAVAPHPTPQTAQRQGLF